MLPVSNRTSSYLKAAFVLVSAALFLHLALPEAITIGSTAGPGAVSPHARDKMSGSTAARWRAHEVGGAEGTRRRGVKRFVLQESSGSGSGAEPSWRTLSFKEVTGLWKSRGELVQTIATCIKEVDFPAVFWESVPVTRSTTDKPYEYVLVDSPALARVSQDGGPFDEYISSGEGKNRVVSFRNIRKDACLVVPCEAGTGGGATNGNYNYAHLAAFVRTAPAEQVVNFFGAVGEALEKEIDSRTDESPVWLSTSGLGVYWLHARLDSVPKYYTYTPYKKV